MKKGGGVCSARGYVQNHPIGQQQRRCTKGDVHTPANFSGPRSKVLFGLA